MTCGPNWTPPDGGCGGFALDKERIYVNNSSVEGSDFSCIEVLDIETFATIKRFDKVTGIRFLDLVPDKL